MKNLAFAAAAATIAVGVASAASAQTLQAPAFYGNLGYSFIDGGSDAQLGAIHGRLGAQLHRYFAVEAEGSFGVDGDSAVIGGLPVRTKLRHSAAAYAVGVLPVTPKFDLLVRGGYGASSLRVTSGAVSVKDSEDSWNYGAGAQYSFDGKNGLRGDYTRHDFGNGYGHADVWQISYVRKF
jgi:hypothetical protein